MQLFVGLAERLKRLLVQHNQHKNHRKQLRVPAVVSCAVKKRKRWSEPGSAFRQKL